ncbi:hypothetical protein HaLaN_15244 [Haematococcus lacustris]|uniref:Uncharacterized protein n=1 Tax=Haematococcus lacustris TaxID=44745 RepID=A0A699Z714_HAELA|nr:hypothetical protein HaLaN_15244 [Haematococcus lacustris]
MKVKTQDMWCMEGAHAVCMGMGMGWGRMQAGRGQAIQKPLTGNKGYVGWYVMMMWLTPLKPSAVRLLGRPPPQGVQDFL